MEILRRGEGGSAGAQAARLRLEEVTQRDPGSARAWHTLGQMAEEEGQLAAARDMFSRGVSPPSSANHAGSDPFPLSPPPFLLIESRVSSKDPHLF